MLTRHNLMIGIPLAVILLLLIPSVIVPHQGVRRVLFTIVLFAAIVVLITYFIVMSARQDRAQAEHDALSNQVVLLRKVLYRHLAICARSELEQGMDVDKLINNLLNESAGRER
jgi:archaellum biogenesis protein FlaJ (TadC family)